jgi:Fe-S oxidoreductase
MGLESYTVTLLEKCGYDVTTSDVECCGMAGSFGYKEQYYDLSMDVGDHLREQLEAVECDYTVASGTSCTEQIEDLLDSETYHPAELLAPAA